MQRNKPKLTWVNILHIYQPPHQSKEVLELVAKESYERILALLAAYPRLKLTLNVSGSLIELFEVHKLNYIIEGIKNFCAEGRIELLGSAMYHPILPLIPPEEVVRQISLNTERMRTTFGAAYQHAGFFIPEMAYSSEVGRIIKAAGFAWIVLDELHALEPANPNIRYRIKENGLGVVFRNRDISRTFPPEFVEKNIDALQSPYLVTAHDGELYGHWHKDDSGFYEKAFTDPRISFETVSEYLIGLKEEKDTTIRGISWETSEEDIQRDVSYPLWKDPDNLIHEALWAFTRETLALVETHRTDPAYPSAREHLDRGLASCMWWWASARQPLPSSPITWSPDEVEKGLLELIQSIRALSTIPENILREREDEYARMGAQLRREHLEKHI